MARYLVGIDIGTTSSKGNLVDTNGKIIAHHAEPHCAESPRNGWYEQDAEAVWWGDVRKISRALIARSGIAPRDVAAVGVSALTPVMLPVDEQGVPLRKAILHSDCRARQQIEDLIATLARVRPEYDGRRLRSAYYAIAKLYWYRDNEPALYARTFKVHTVSTFIVSKLTGRHVSSYIETGGLEPLFDASKREWDLELAGQLGIPASLLPEVHWSTDVIGEVTAQAAAETGLAEGTPVIAGAHDGITEWLSTGTVAEGEASLRYGTTHGLGTMVSAGTPRVAPTLVIPPPQGALYRLGTSTATAGALTTWFRDCFGQAEMEAQSRLGINAYHLLSEGAYDVPPGSEGLLVLPHFAGERGLIRDSRARGLVIGLTLSHTRRHIYRAQFEGMAYLIRQLKEDIEQRGGAFRRIVGNGGGTQSRLWTRVISDVIGQDQELMADPNVGAPYGAAFLAGYGVGIFHDLTPLHTTWAPATRHVRYNPEAKRIYDQYYPVWCSLYEQNREAMIRLGELAAS